MAGGGFFGGGVVVLVVAGALVVVVLGAGVLATDAVVLATGFVGLPGLHPGGASAGGGSAATAEVALEAAGGGTSAPRETAGTRAPGFVSAAPVGVGIALLAAALPSFAPPSAKAAIATPASTATAATAPITRPAELFFFGAPRLPSQDDAVLPAMGGPW